VQIGPVVDDVENVMKGAGFLLVFTLFWTAIVSVFDVFLISGAVRQARAESYPTVEGEITRSEITEHYDSEDGTTYGADLAFTYDVGGVAYTSEKYRYGEMSSSDRSIAAGIVSAHRVGARVTVYYNPRKPDDAILQPGIAGQDLFLALFLTPFNIVMLALWFGVGGVVWRTFHKPPAGGVAIVNRGGRVFVRLPRISPLAAGAATALAISFVSIFVVGFGFGFDPSMPVIGAVWTVVLLGAGGVYFWRKLVVGSGAKDLVIDDGAGMLSLPQTFGRDTDVIVGLDAVTGVDVKQNEHRDSDGDTSYTYAPELVWTGDGGGEQRGRLADWNDEERAHAFAGWLRERLGRSGGRSGVRA
jgi:hypothetical protein